IVRLFLCTISSSLNVFFNFRQPAPAVVALALLLIAYPFGKFLAFVVPITTYRFRSFEVSLNPGPWNIKEHVLIFIMADVAVGNPYALNAIVVSEFFYEIKVCRPCVSESCLSLTLCQGRVLVLVLVLATQLTGFGLAGVCRRFLVWPASMV
ncbi:OPT oligopeptide transporter protein-domain-containing protein, partial [Mycena galopus ATCC 62051]